MSDHTIRPNPEHSPREHIIERIFEVLRDNDHGDDRQTAVGLLGWIEARLLGKDDDGSTKYVNPDHPVEFL